uniref:Uncharacterized protein n=1 Tax=Rhizophora mucronata TaxID=61149 RepID=A0A2P2P794_RHIMU
MNGMCNLLFAAAINKTLMFSFLQSLIFEVVAVFRTFLCTLKLSYPV